MDFWERMDGLLATLKVMIDRLKGSIYPGHGRATAIGEERSYWEEP